MVHGRSNEVGAALVTSSVDRSRGLHRVPCAADAPWRISPRSVTWPIPVYAEMGSLNPVFLLPGPGLAR